MIDKGFEAKPLPPDIADALNEAAARIDAVRLVALIALEEVVRMQRGEIRRTDLHVLADQLERIGKGRAAGEQLSRIKAASWMRVLADGDVKRPS